MELYLDSVNIEEIEKASHLGYLHGLTTTPTFMVREGIKDVDAQMLKLAKMVNVLQVEALGNTAEEIFDEAERLVNMGLSKEKTVFKIPISLEGTKACRMLRNKGFLVNLHLVYTVQQAYMAMSAGATYVCPLVGRLQDQGHNALELVKGCVDITQKYNYDTKIMFSSVRHVEHVKNALEIGVQACTIPWKIMEKLTNNHFTQLGTDQFIKDTKLLTAKVSEVTKTEHTSIDVSKKVIDAALEMTKSKMGAIIVMQESNEVYRMFTDGDLRRLIEENEGNIHNLYLKDLPSNTPKSIDAFASFQDALNICSAEEVDTLMVTKNGEFNGLVDIQDLIQ